MGMSDMKMEISTWGLSKQGKLMGTVTIHGQNQVKSMTENGKEVFDKVMESGKTKEVIVIQENGETGKPLDMGFSHGIMEINMRENGIVTLSMGKEQISLSMETITKESIKMESLKGMEYILGLMDVTMKEILKQDLSMEKEDGRKWQNDQVDLQMNIQESIKEIKNVVMENLDGQQEIFTKVTTMKTKEKDKGK